jgi:uncharacterized protein (TIGR00297 family)
MNWISTLFEAPLADWLKFAAFLIGISLAILIAEKTRSLLGWPAEVTRKFVHIIVGILIFFTPFFFASNRPLIWMAVLFIIVNYLGVRSGSLKGMHGTGRTSYGTVFYPLTFLILVLLCWKTQKVVLMLSMLILALPDALAAIVGENLKHPHEYTLGQDKKSVEGSIMMALSTFLIVFLIAPVIAHVEGTVISNTLALWMGVLTAFMATALESLSSQGSDNLTAPLGSALVMGFMINQSQDLRIQWTIGCGLALLIALLAHKARFLKASGSVGTFILATVIFGAGGWTWTLPILVFFILSSILSNTGKKRKKRLESVFEKSGQRDIGQVIANGGIPAVLVLLNLFSPARFWYPACLGALAAVNADTWATEIGVLSRIRPRLITTGKVVSHGVSGGLTPLGLIGALTGSMIIMISGLLVQPQETGLTFGRGLFWWIIVSGFTASLVDSLLGATLQTQYRCANCHQLTEKKIHCGIISQHISGIKGLNNDSVNFLCALCGSLFVFFGLMCGI